MHKAIWVLGLASALVACDGSDDTDDASGGTPATCEGDEVDIAADIAAAQSCAVDSDCAILGDHCPFGCGLVVRADQRDALASRIDTWEADCASCVYDCAGAAAVTCDEGVCTAVSAR